ncbi:MAG: iron ABC transporter permease [Hyphomicrobiaceae bacterium]|nr:iron ABC transporter permease [Hyphomicrobiaceae bacterium]
MSVAASRIEASAAARGRAISFRPLPWLWPLFLLLILGVLVIYPVARLVLGSLTDVNPMTAREALPPLTLEHYLDLAVNPTVRAATVNSLLACSFGALLSVVTGLLFAWIVVRTNTPMKGLIRSAGLMPLFIPPLVAGFAWSLLGSPETGLINVVLQAMGLPWKVNFYSLTGITVVFGVYYAPYVFMFTASALENMDPSLEEASEVSGSSVFQTMMRITIPLMAPAILSGGLLAFVIMLGVYGTPAILGTPANEPFLTTYLFSLLSWTPPLYNKAAAVSMLLVAVTALGIWLQQRALRGRSFVTVAGKSFRPKLIDLGRWRYFTLAFGLLYLFFVVVLPFAALLIVAFRKYMFVPDIGSLFDARQYSLGHFEALFANPLTMRSIWNSLIVGGAAAIFGGALAFAIAYTVQRTSVRLRTPIDYIATVPVAIPGLVIGVAYLWAWVGLPGGLYGTTAILAIAFIARFLPDTMKALSTSLIQIHRELEEASWICGLGLLTTIRKVVVPLTLPGLISGMTLLFVLSIRELGSSLFLYTSDSIIMSVLLLDFWEGGSIGVSAAFSVFQSALLFLIIGSVSWLTRRKR